MQDSDNTTIIDLGLARKEAVNERFRHRRRAVKIKITVGQYNKSRFGINVRKIMNAVFRGRDLPVKIIGTKGEVKSFIEAMKRETQYLKTARRYGLDDHRTYKKKYKLKRAVSKFERDTGLKWPLEN